MPGKIKHSQRLQLTFVCQAMGFFHLKFHANISLFCCALLDSLYCMHLWFVEAKCLYFDCFFKIRLKYMWVLRGKRSCRHEKKSHWFENLGTKMLVISYSLQVFLLLMMAWQKIVAIVRICWPAFFFKGGVFLYRLIEINSLLKSRIYLCFQFLLELLKNCLVGIHCDQVYWINCYNGVWGGT